jgi:CheY-like chemotaxis protein
LDAAGVDEALAILEGGDVDVIISDVAMPGRDGYALMREVRSRARMAKIPAIALTASADQKDTARRAG